MLSSRKKLKKAHRGSPLWHGKLNHCLLTWTWSLFCSDRSRVVRGKWLTLLFPRLVLLVRCQTSMSWTHHFFLRLPWLTQQRWQPCLSYQTHRTQGSLPRKVFAHTLRVHETSRTMCLKINHKLALAALCHSTAVKDLPCSAWKSFSLRFLIPSSPSCHQLWTPLSSLFL